MKKAVFVFLGFFVSFHVNAQINADNILHSIFNNTEPKNTIIEVREKMFIAQTNDIYLNAEDYLGKTIKLEGLLDNPAPP